MQAAMDRLERFISAHRKVVLGVWAVILLASLPFAAQQTKHLTAGGFEVPGSGSLTASDALTRFPGVRTEPLILVFDNAKRNPAALQAAVGKAVAGTRGVPGISVSPQAAAAARASAQQPIVLLPLNVNGGADKAVDAAVTLRKNLNVTDSSVAVPVHVVGQQALWAGLQDVSKTDLEKAESAGFPVVFIILLAVIGSLAAAVLPLSLGFVAVIITGAVIFFLSETLEMSVFVTNVASLLGIGVAVDYSLFILARYRQELAEGRDYDAARAVALRTSGLAVVVSGATVLISLAGLFLIDSKTMHSMAVGAIVVVAIAILAAVTLLPVLIQMLGRRAAERGKGVQWVGARLRRLLPQRDPEAAAKEPFWDRWTARLMRRPVLFASAAVLVMLVLAIPALSLKWGTAALGQLPKNFETRVGFEEAARAAGPGALGPVQVVADFGRRPIDGGAVSGFAAAAQRTPGVARVARPVRSADGHAVLVTVTPTTGPEDSRTVALVKRLRAPSGPAGSLQRVATVSVGGAAAQNSDFSDLISGSLWKILVFVLGFSYLVLFFVLRSVLLPLKAVIMNLLSVAAAYGVLVTVFQYGWFDSVLGFDHLGYVNALTPPLLLAIVFGLSMDYEVFLLSRIKERYGITRDNRTAVAQGLAASAKTISSAALIMVAVFAIFALTGLPQVKEIGVGLAVAVFLDATLVRLVLVPATMELLGDWNWWLPKSLDRLMPDLDFEGSEPPPAAAESEPSPALVAK
jgi:RND superfamily putative drug exporter